MCNFSPEPIYFKTHNSNSEFWLDEAKSVLSQAQLSSEWLAGNSPGGSIRAIKGPWLEPQYLNLSLCTDWHNSALLANIKCIHVLGCVCLYAQSICLIKTVFGYFALWQSFSSIMQSTICITTPPWAIIRAERSFGFIYCQWVHPESKTPALQHYSSC